MYHFSTKAYRSPSSDAENNNQRPSSSSASKQASNQYRSSTVWSKTHIPGLKNNHARRPTGGTDYPGIDRAATEAQEEDYQTIDRTWSGSLFMKRRSSKDDRSRALAQELSDRFELSEVKEDDLNKKSVLKQHIVGGVGLAASMMSVQEAIAINNKTEETWSKKENPLKPERERSSGAKKSSKELRKEKIRAYYEKKMYEEEASVEVSLGDSTSMTSYSGSQSAHVAPVPIVYDLPNIC